MKNTPLKNTFPMSREHLANERTFLAWIRTSIALMGFGFVIIKFSVFLQEMAYWVESESVSQDENSSLIGMIMVGAGIVLALMSYFRYRRTSRQLDQKTFSNSVVFSLVLTIFLVDFCRVIPLFQQSSLLARHSQTKHHPDLKSH